MSNKNKKLIQAYNKITHHHLRNLSPRASQKKSKVNTIDLKKKIRKRKKVKDKEKEKTTKRKINTEINIKDPINTINTRKIIKRNTANLLLAHTLNQKTNLNHRPLSPSLGPSLGPNLNQVQMANPHPPPQRAHPSLNPRRKQKERATRKRSQSQSQSQRTEKIKRSKESLLHLLLRLLNLLNLQRRHPARKRVKTRAALHQISQKTSLRNSPKRKRVQIHLIRNRNSLSKMPRRRMIPNLMKKSKSSNLYKI